MKKSAVLINTARGPLLKTEDLITALKTGIISGAGIDVYETDRRYWQSFWHQAASQR